MTEVKATMETVEIDGKEYVTPAQMAAVAHLSEKTINHYILYGNSVRKMRSLNRFGRRFIPVEELKEFPFTGKGRFGYRKAGPSNGDRSALPGVDEVSV